MRWEIRPIKCLKYVDDCLSLEKVHFKESEKINVEENCIALSRATSTQDQFRTIEYNASQIGMQINHQKTKMQRISAARSYTARSYLLSTDDTKITSSNTLKILGFTFSSEPNAKVHLQNIAKKI